VKKLIILTAITIFTGCAHTPKSSSVPFNELGYDRQEEYIAQEKSVEKQLSNIELEKYDAQTQKDINRAIEENRK
jgi:hypothetical protein